MRHAEKTKAQLLAEIERAEQRIRELESLVPPTQDEFKAAPANDTAHCADYFRILVNTIPDLVWLKDPHGIYLACNPTFERFFGAKESEIIGKTDYDFVSKELADFFRQHDKRAMAAGKPSINEETLTFADSGKTGFFETIKTPMTDVDGKLIGVLGVARDITDLKRANDALEKRMIALTKPLDNAENVEFEDLFNLDDIQRLQDEFAQATGVGSMITHPDGTPITRPSNFCRLCMDIIRKTEKGRANCFRSDAILGQLKDDGPTIQTCMSGGLWDAGAGIAIGGHHVANWLIGQVRDESQTEEKMRAYAREIGADEDEVVLAFFEVQSMPREQFESISMVLFTLANQLSKIAYQNIQQARFINDLKQTKSELATTRHYLSNIIDSMPSLLIGVDPQCRVTLWNMKAETTARIHANEVLGKNLTDVLPRLAGELDRIHEALRTRTSMTDSLQTVREGKVCHENITIYPLIANNVEGAVLRVDDVTERIQLEQMMVQSEKMMSVGGLAAGMAHEINNPLAGVLGYAINIKKRIFGDLKKNKTVAAECGISLEDVREYLKRRDIPKMLDGIHEAGARAASIVSNMLSFSRKSERKLNMFSMSSLLDNTLELAASDYNLKKYYDFKKIVIIREYEADVPHVFCDANEIQQVFLNVLKNGAEAMAEKTYTDVEPCLVCRVKKDNDMVVAEIEDNGPGIEEDIRKRVFEPFYTTKEVGKGTGLGLSVSYFIVTNQHRGSMDVESVPGEWTRFIIKLPFNEGRANVVQNPDS
ncbi:PocR ligand-binding domain-containing protein [Desulfovibrio inopinatus]|uniref:PocR ligand-binding domain-containing protein n=1 Tax=Desulfovibrio inopinatus TaxID=102109 RepID=UPI0003FE8F19|nr:PocR ligand-binding domain-containing protein [Desulfovibrio inopinatus]